MLLRSLRTPAARLVILAGAITLIGIALRTIKIGSVPFQHWDDVYTARTIVRYYPTAQSEFRLSFGSGPNDAYNPLTFVKSIHGPLTLMVGFVWMHLVALTGLPIDEPMWHLPFALLGALLIPTSYALGTRLRNQRAGLLAAALVAVLPIHVAFSRISGEAHFILAAGLQQACLLLWHRYLAQRTPRTALATGVVLGLAILTDFFFVGLLVTLGVMTLLHLRRQQGGIPIWTALRTLGQWRMALPALGPLLFQGALAGYTLVSNQPTGMFGRVLSQLSTAETQAGGMALAGPLANLVHGSNGLFVIVVVGALVLFGITRAYRDDGIIVALVYPLVYLLPLLFIQRERLIGHHIPVLTGLCVFLACVLDHVSSTRRWRRVVNGGVALLSGALLLTTLSMVYRVPVVPLLAAEPEHGAVGQDHGTKAAAWWIIHNTPEDALVYGDAFAHQDFAVTGYYYRRATAGLSIPLPDIQAQVDNALKGADTFDYLVLGIENVPAFPASFMAPWEVYAVVTVQAQPRLHIYGPRPRPNAETPVPVLESTTLNERYDQTYAIYPTLVER